jgi:hypothetical protein
MIIIIVRGVVIREYGFKEEQGVMEGVSRDKIVIILNYDEVKTIRDFLGYQNIDDTLNIIKNII